ncbi:MAG TPA: hypothetical protein VGO35_03930 [Gammaproteobacteria bacterium]|nr:hypothetical protein [Gammaproteobacteria bacterium]
MLGRISSNSTFRILWKRLNGGSLGLFLGLILCASAGGLIATNYLQGKDVRTFSMLQELYSPAVGIACGYGYTNLPRIPGDSLEQFLYSKADTFDCTNALSPDKYPVVNGDVSGCRYLIAIVGELWRVTGPSWHSVKFVIGVLYILMAVAAFLLARTVIGSFFSTGIVLLFVSAPANIELMSRLRDLGKAPFILLACAALLWGLGFSSRRRLGLAALTGLIIGIGYGFRPDILALLPLSVLLIFFLAPREILWYKRLAAAAVLPFAFFLSAYPALFSTNPVGTNTMPHVVILGLSHLSDYDLGVQPGNYSWGINHEDNSVADAMNAYAALKFPQLKQVRYTYPEYGDVGRSYLWEMLRTFPADMALRAESSAVSLSDESVIDVFRLKDSEAVKGIWLLGLVWLSIAGIFCIGYKNPLRALGFGLIFAYLTCIIALQFEERHYFYMEVFVLTSLAAVLNFLVDSRFRPSPKAILIALGGSAILIASVLVIEMGFQYAQSLWVGPRLNAFISSPRKPLIPVIQHKVMTYVAFPQLHGEGTDNLPLYPESPLPSYPLVMTIDQSRCGSTWRYFTVDYGVLKHLDYTFWIQPYPDSEFGIWSEQHVLPNIAQLGDKIQITVPLYRDGTALREIQLSPGMAGCVVKWERLYSNDALFDLMNWVIDKPEHLIPFRIELSKPRP